MARWAGKIGYEVETETEPGIVETNIIERSYTGELIKASRYLANDNQVNSSVSFSNQISIVSDPYTLNNLSSMRYLTFMGGKWKISNIDVQYPRLILTMGGVYNAG